MHLWSHNNSVGDKLPMNSQKLPFLHISHVHNSTHLIAHFHPVVIIFWRHCIYGIIIITVSYCRAQCQLFMNGYAVDSVELHHLLLC